MHELVILEQSVTLGIEKEMLVISREGQALRHSKLQDIDRVILHGNISLTPAARRTLLFKGIDVVFLSERGNYQGRLLGKPSKHGELRMAQYHFCSDPERVLDTSLQIVAGKLRNQRNQILKAQRRLQKEELTAPLAGMRRSIAKAETAENLDTLRGIEGQGAALYFQAFPHLIRQEGFEMNGRNRRPPRDPINAVLSFGYTVLTHLVEAQVLRTGLDPHLGCFHQLHYGRPSLALDLVEEFRPVVIDALVLRLINRGQLKPCDFYRPDEAEMAEVILEEGQEVQPGEAVYLADTGRKIFFRAFYKRLRETIHYPLQERQLLLKDILTQQAYHLARVIKGEEGYRPFVPR